MSWTTVCTKEQIQEDFPCSVEINDKKVGVYLVEGAYYALEDICPHAYALLSQGFVENGQVECPLHEAVFDIKSGKCIHDVGFGGKSLQTYPIRIVDNAIQIQTDNQESDS
ncbi:Rieske (2Fe-2S) protein [Microbulbifer sp. 2201CG32-9]|uniref:Rieske (2Fe-2S) protein n=1 Tax=unclassified Microbulbifer TaxID=2619833 RepID=UPI00345C3E87